MDRVDYDEIFLETMDLHAAASAEVVVPLVQSTLPIRSVADFGCGRGEWLGAWKAQQVADVFGVDGEYVSPNASCLNPGQFRAADLAQPVRLDRSFDLVQALEVAEHLPEASADTFVETLTAHSRKILFSAAVPGQMGIQHINERPYEYWRQKFSYHDFVLFDWLRQRLVSHPEVSYWYRYNLLFFVHVSEVARLPKEVQASRVSPHDRVPDIAPLSYSARRSVTRWLPVSVTDRLVRHMLRRQYAVPRTS